MLKNDISKGKFSEYQNKKPDVCETVIRVLGGLSTSGKQPRIQHQMKNNVISQGSTQY